MADIYKAFHETLFSLLNFTFIKRKKKKSHIESRTITIQDWREGQTEKAHYMNNGLQIVLIMPRTLVFVWLSVS